MALNVTQEDLSAVSTFAVKGLLRAENMGTFTTTLGDQWVDPLDPTITNILTTLKSDTQLYTYTAGMAITTVSQELYGTTSAWWIILYLNGYAHPDEISDGASLQVPSVLAIQTLLRTTAQNNKGTTVTV